MSKVYMIYAETSQDIESAKREFKANYALIKRYLDKDTIHSNMAVVMGLSQNDGFMSKVVNDNEGKRGRPKKKFVRNEKSGLYHTSIPHETHLHMHIYIGGNGASTVAKDLSIKRNKKAGKKIWVNRPREDGCIPYDYVKDQSFEFRTIGDYESYL